MFGEIDILPIMPPSGEDFDFDAIDCLPTGPEVTITDDFELLTESGCPVLEIIGEKSKITFFTNCTLPFVALHLKNIDRFLGITMGIQDDKGENRIIKFTNKRSLVIVDKNECNLPLELGEGWQYLSLDFQRICNNAFGSNYVGCTEITVHGSCRLSKLFFQSEEYADVELPEFLRVCVREN